MEDHGKLSANRNFVVELEPFEVKRRKNYRFEIPRRKLSSKYVFSHASVKDHGKLRANRNYVVELERFEVKRRKNYRIRDSKTLTFL
jgi:hypothetical protein